MKTRYTVALAMLAGVAIGAIAVQSLHAQAKPPVYVVTEIDVSNMDAYGKDYAPIAQAAIKATGGRLLAVGQPIATLEGTPQKLRISINQYDSLEQAQKSRASMQYQDARKVGDKYAKFRAYVLEGRPQ